MDDYVIFAKTRNKLKAAIKRMYAELDTLQFTVHPDKRYIGKTEKGFDRVLRISNFSTCAVVCIILLEWVGVPD
ncbi:MAG: hypothetical protein EBU49_10385 [Proteobacteria bacterium]|nr:hypothetical protein [Pseudomonadota bacterium]